MDKNEYLEKFVLKAKQGNFDEHYISECVNYADRLLDNNLPVVFDLFHLSLLLGVQVSFLQSVLFSENLFYTEYNIRKKSGGVRVLNAPSLGLKCIQRWILDNILNNIAISNFSTGFCVNKSIVDNARIHLGQDCILNMDISDFFPTISFERIFGIFKYYGYTKEVSFFLAKLCTYQGSLPQGSPASPALSNIVCRKLDKRLSKLAEKYDAKYSRYADDITFSGNKQISNIIEVCRKILFEEDFVVNDKKTRIAFKNQRQEVTGIIINDGKLRVNKHYKRALKQEIYYCSRFGVQSHLDKINCNKTFYKEHLYGKAYFIKMVEPLEGKLILDSLDKIDWSY